MGACPQDGGDEQAAQAQQDASQLDVGGTAGHDIKQSKPSKTNACMISLVGDLIDLSSVLGV